MPGICCLYLVEFAVYLTGEYDIGVPLSNTTWNGTSQIVTGLKQKGNKQVPLRKPFSYLLHKALFHLAQHCSNLLLRIRIIHLFVKKITRSWIVDIKLNHPSAEQREYKGFIIFALILTFKFINVKWMVCHSHKRATWGPTICSTSCEIGWLVCFVRRWFFSILVSFYGDINNVSHSTSPVS